MVNTTFAEQQITTVGEKDLQTLLEGMTPTLDPRIFVFVTIVSDQLSEHIAEALMVFREGEGVTLIVEEAWANARGLTSTFRCQSITLQIHSSLDAVGFLAAIVPALAGAGIGVNPVSAFFHDHLFVPADQAEDAMQTLRILIDG